MAILIKHREDGIVQKHAEDGCPDHLKQCYYGINTIPAHEVLFKFLEERLIGKEFENREAIKEVLLIWPEFVLGQNFIPVKEFTTLVLEDNRGGKIVFPNTHGGPYVVATIHTKK